MARFYIQYGGRGDMVPPDGKWQFGSCSDKGYVRAENEDNMGQARHDWGQIFVVADGMGGHKAGRLASELTVEGLLKRLEESLPAKPVAEAIEQAFQETNRVVHEKACCGDPETKGLGSTAVMLIVMGQRVVVAHVGDSRAYLYRGGTLHRLTKDHSLVQRMMDAGMLSPSEARNHPDANVIYRAIGDKPTVEVDIQADLSAEEGDGFLLCSDGLCGYVDDESIEAALGAAGSAQEKAERLVRLGLDAGGLDNISVQFLQYGEPAKRRSRRKGWLSRAGGGLWARLFEPLWFVVTLPAPASSKQESSFS